MGVSRRSVLWLGLFGIVTVSSFAGCNAQPPAGVPGAGKSGGVKRIILLTNGNSPFWDAAKAGMEKAKADEKLTDANLDAIMEYNDGTIDGQLTKLRQFSSQDDIAGIAISAINADNINVAEELKALKAKGVAVVTFDSDVDRAKFRDARTAFIGSDNYQGGHELGLCLKQLLPDGGEFVSFVGFLDAQNAKDRIEGVAKGAGEKLKSVDSMADAFDTTKARDNVRNALANHPDVKAVVGIYSYNAPAIVDVVKELDKRASLKVVAFDAEPIAIEQMGQGQIDAMIVQNPYQMGYQSVRFLKAVITKDEKTQKEILPKLGEEDGDIYDTGLKVVVPNSSSPIQKNVFGPKTEFLTFDAFKAWLTENHLTGS